MKAMYLILALVLVGSLSCRKNDVTPISTTSTNSISQEEKDDLLFLIEEEKLARDVYIYAYNKYGDAIFNNISGSEQKHMDKIAGLIDKYNLTNPIEGLNEGEFQNADLQQLYIDLIARVDISLTEAYFVGATIEDLDIHDIDTQVNNTSKSDLLDAYSKLTCGSTNHIRAFVSQIVAQGESYSPQFISQGEFDEIINSNHQQCGNH